jgi:hypothetical protein
MTGKSIDRNPSAVLDPYFSDVVEEMKKKKLQLSIDFTTLQYMNSSTVSPVINFIRKLEENAVKSVVLYDSKLKWQMASFKALETIIRNFQNVSLKGL